MQISVLLAEQIAELFLMILMGYVIVKLGLVTDDDSKIGRLLNLKEHTSITN